MATPITKVTGIGAQTAEILVENGFENAESLAVAREEDLLEINGFGPSKAKKFIEAAQTLVGTDGALENPISEQSAKVVIKAEVEAEKVDEVKVDIESENGADKTEKSVEKFSGPKVCTQKFAKAKKKNKNTKAKKKKKKSSRKKKSK